MPGQKLTPAKPNAWAPQPFSDMKTSNLKTVKIPILKICQRYKIILLYVVSNAKKNYFRENSLTKLMYFMLKH